MLDFTTVPARLLAAHGRDKLAEACGVKPGVLDRWAKTGSYPVAALQRMIEFDPGPLHADFKPLYPTLTVPGKVAILLPSNRPIHSHVWTAMVKMMQPGDILPPQSFTFNSIYHVRNMAAHWFMAQNVPWSYWNDDDVIPPCGDFAWFKQAIDRPLHPDVYAGLNTLLRLLVHQRMFMSGVYFARRRGGEPQFDGGADPAVKSNLRRGPRDMIMPDRKWVGFGCALVHRQVFLDIQQKFPDLRVKNEQVRQRLGYDWSYFNPVEQDYGDDISFCRRATEAGHNIAVDFAVMAGHLGSRAYFHDDL